MTGRKNKGIILFVLVIATDPNIAITYYWYNHAVGTRCDYYINNGHTVSTFQYVLDHFLSCILVDTSAWYNCTRFLQ